MSRTSFRSMGLLCQSQFVLASSALWNKLGNIASLAPHASRNVRRVMLCDTMPPLPKIARSVGVNQWQAMIVGGAFPLSPLATVVGSRENWVMLASVADLSAYASPILHNIARKWYLRNTRPRNRDTSQSPRRVTLFHP